MQSSLEPLPANVLSSATEMLGEAVTNVEKAEGGANNRVYRVRAGRRIYALKLYPATAGDTRDRLGTETAAISFMQKHGVRIVPALVGVDVAKGIGLYEWIDGEAVGTATDADIAAAARLLSVLHPLRLSAAATELPLASEACLAGSEIVAQIKRRLARLQEVATETSESRRAPCRCHCAGFPSRHGPRAKPVRRRWFGLCRLHRSILPHPQPFRFRLPQCPSPVRPQLDIFRF